MKNVSIIKVLFLVSCALLLFSNISSATDKVVIIPLLGTVGNARAANVMEGKTFSSKVAGKGVTGSLKLRAGAVLYTNSIGMEFSLIPAGSFIMGSPAGTGDTDHRPVWPEETGHWIFDSNNEPTTNERQHVVILTKSFYMQTTEVTQGQWEAVMGPGTNPSHFNTCGQNCPVERVSWTEANDFIDALNLKEGRAVRLNGRIMCLPNKQCYSLPTEAQWEYAARAGTVTAYYNGDSDQNLDNIFWYEQNSGDTTHPVAQKIANNWGLYDMLGNVAEWCRNRYCQDYPDGPVTDPDPDSYCGSDDRIIRGGCWYWNSMYERAAARTKISPDMHSNRVGFRIVLPPGQFVVIN